MARTWLITGISRGLGHALATAALEAGDRVIGTTRSGDAPEGLSGDLTVLPFEASDPEAAARLATDAFGVHGRIDVLVNNAGSDCSVRSRRPTTRRSVTCSRSTSSRPSG